MVIIRHPRVRVLICDDNLAVRTHLARALRFKPNLEVTGEIGSFEELEASIDSLAPEVLLMDVNMPGTNGLEGIEKLRARGLALPIIIMSADKHNEDQALSAGAASFFYKGSTELGELVRVIRLVAQRQSDLRPGAGGPRDSRAAG